MIRVAPKRCWPGGLRLLKLGRADPGALPKAQTEKQVQAWWLYGGTTVKRRWLAERLAMGYETRISQAVRGGETSGEPTVLGRKNELIERKT
jgi:hypothetical protein